MFYLPVAYKDSQENRSEYYHEELCLPCAPGCVNCLGPEPCLALFNWPFRYLLLSQFPKKPTLYNINVHSLSIFSFLLMQNLHFGNISFMCFFYTCPCNIHVPTQKSKSV